MDTALIVDEPFLLPAHIDLAALRVKFDAGTLPPMFVDLINAPSRRQVDDSLAAAKSKSALLQRLEGLPEDEQQAVLLDLVRTNIATVLGNSSPETIDPDRAFQELGFDSLTAVEMRNRLKSATGLALSPTLIFDYPNSAALAGYMHRELVGTSRAKHPGGRARGSRNPARGGIHSGQAPSAGGRAGTVARVGKRGRRHRAAGGRGRRPPKRTSRTWTSTPWSTRR